MQLYSQILDHGGPAFGIILRHIKDHPTEPFIFHCTGKIGLSTSFDAKSWLPGSSWQGSYRNCSCNHLASRRTLATFLGNILNLSQLAEVDDESIAEDYALTRVGREPAREKVMKRLMQEPMFANDREAMAKMFTCAYVAQRD
jgi:hypothetical protein